MPDDTPNHRNAIADSSDAKDFGDLEAIENVPFEETAQPPAQEPLSWFKLVARAAVIAFYLVWHSVRWLTVRLGMALSGQDEAHCLAWFSECLLRLFRDLGATFIKVGQIMSTRPDLLPPHAIDALEKLQDQVGPFDFALVQETIIEDFGEPLEDIFESFSNEPIASASVAQVHQARLRDGRTVAVKVRRPRVDLIVAFDLAVMRLAARLMCLIPSIRLFAPVEAVDEFGRGVRLQLDFSIEAKNNERFRRCFAGNSDVVFPVLVKELCSRRVLTMDFIEGVKVLQFRQTRHDPARLARIGFHLLLKMVFEDGFVHADLHPGNILITPEGRIALVDLGLVGEVEQKKRLDFMRFFAAWAQRDGKTMSRVLLELSPARAQTPSREGFERAVDDFVQRTWGKPIGDLQIGAVVLDLLHILRRYGIRVNPTFTMVSIAIAVTEGIGRQLDPSLNLMQEAVPFFAKLQKSAA
ncbi:MAG: AarF/UbiB family protein [Pseudomonadota bacterium]